MNKNQIRQLALLLLDDQHGISQTAWSRLAEMLAADNNDILSKVQCLKERYFLLEEDAEELEKVVVN